MKQLLKERYDSGLGINLKMYLTDKGIQYAATQVKKAVSFPLAFQSPLYAHVSITDSCNLSCSYCYARDNNTLSGEMTLSNVMQLIDILDKNGIFAVTWTGGEPFCHSELSKIVKETNARNISQTILTNGAFIPEGFIEKGPKMNILYQFSLNNAFDRDEENLNYHLAVFKNIRRCNASNVANIISIILQPVTYEELDNLFERLIKNDVTRVRFGYMYPIGMEKRFIFSEYFKKLSYCIPFYTAIRAKYKGKIHAYFQFDEINVNNRQEIIPYRFSMCEAATTLTYIDNDGIVYPCPLFKSEKAFQCGNVFDTKWDDLWNAKPMINIRKQHACTACEEKCKGWCRALRFFSDKRLDGIGSACRRKLMSTHCSEL